MVVEFVSSELNFFQGSLVNWLASSDTLCGGAPQTTIVPEELSGVCLQGSFGEETARIYEWQIVLSDA